MKVIRNDEWKHTFSTILYNMQQKGQLCDAVIETADKTRIPVHACALATASPLLSALLLENYQASDSNDLTPIVMSSDIHSNVWRAILVFIYTGELEFCDETDDFAENVQCTATSLQMSGLQRAFENSSWHLVKDLSHPILEKPAYLSDQTDAPSVAHAEEAKEVECIAENEAVDTTSCPNQGPHVLEDGELQLGLTGLETQLCGDVNTDIGSKTVNSSIVSVESMIKGFSTSVTPNPTKNYFHTGATYGYTSTDTSALEQGLQNAMDPMTNQLEPPDYTGNVGEDALGEDNIANKLSSSFSILGDCDLNTSAANAIALRLAAETSDLMSIQDGLSLEPNVNKDTDSLANINMQGDGLLENATSRSSSSMNNIMAVGQCNNQAVSTEQAVDSLNFAKFLDTFQAVPHQPVQFIEVGCDAIGLKLYLCLTCKSTVTDIHKHTKDHELSQLSKCTLCGNSYTNLKRHMECKHPGDNGVSCQKCRKSFRTQYHLKRHLAIACNTTRLFQCTMCNRKLKRKSDFDLHMRLHTNHKPHVCRICFKAFAAVKRLRAHMAVHETGEYSCHCGKVFSSEKNYKYHFNLAHNLEYPHRCKVCLRSGRNAAWLEKHALTHTKRHLCKHCKKGFDTERGLILHETMHLIRSDNPLHCPICQTTLKSRRILQRHIMDMHSVVGSEFKCSECDRLFDSETSLRSHKLRTHESSKPQCPVCEQQLDDVKQLNEHLLDAHGFDETLKPQKILMCVLCKRFFNTHDEFKSHEATHDVPVQCKFCKLTFHSLPKLRRHRCGKLYCVYCEALFKTPNALERHVELHMKSKVLFNCDLCSESFSTVTAKQKHCIETHSQSKHSESETVRCKEPLKTQTASKVPSKPDNFDNLPFKGEHIETFKPINSDISSNSDKPINVDPSNHDNPCSVKHLSNDDHPNQDNDAGVFSFKIDLLDIQRAANETRSFEEEFTCNGTWKHTDNHVTSSENGDHSNPGCQSSFSETADLNMINNMLMSLG